MASKRTTSATATDENTCVPEDVKRRVYAECELEKAFGEMIADIREHNSEYHHITPEKKIEAWEKRLRTFKETR